MENQIDSWSVSIQMKMNLLSKKIKDKKIYYLKEKSEIIFVKYTYGYNKNKNTKKLI